jgi:hypothetical protein
MNRTAARIAIALLAFMFGIIASSLWHYNRTPQSLPPPVNPVQPAPIEPTTAPDTSAPDSEITLGNGLRFVSNEVQIHNEFLRYKVNVTYPQIEGSDAPPIRNLNKSIERLVTNQYQWLLNPSREDLRYYKLGLHPEAFNSHDLNYEVITASDSFLSIYFESYSYGIGAAHSVHTSFVVNYDLASNRQLKLSDIFKPDAKYLKLIAELCTEKLLHTTDGEYLNKVELAPVAANFESWNMTNEGIRFNFDACKVFACAGGKQSVLIPFAALRPMMSIR